jgi:hypothetical protein
MGGDRYPVTQSSTVYVSGLGQTPLPAKFQSRPTTNLDDKSPDDKSPDRRARFRFTPVCPGFPLVLLASLTMCRFIRALSVHETPTKLPIVATESKPFVHQAILRDFDHGKPHIFGAFLPSISDTLSGCPV